MSTDRLESLTTREKQAYGALCFAKFCTANKLFHDSISKLAEHLLSILVSHSLPDWEDRGTTIEITGRGDPLPDPLIEIIPEDQLEAFTQLVECVVEVGIVDMYGATTDEPLNFLKKCIEILKSRGIEPPKLEHVFNYRQTEIKKNMDWGDPISTLEYEKILEIYDDIIK